MRKFFKTRHAIAEMLLPLEKARRIEILLLQKLDI